METIYASISNAIEVLTTVKIMYMVVLFLGFRKRELFSSWFEINFKTKYVDVLFVSILSYESPPSKIM